MKKITNILSMVLLALSMSLTGCVKDLGVIDNPNDGGNTPEKDPNFKSIIVMSDIHVMAPQLLEKKGTAYENYLNQDPKLLEYSGEVLECLVEKTLERNPDLVIIPGDLTKDGELLSHQLVVNILGKLRSAGIPVIVVPGNHDIDNPEGYYFNGDNTRPAERTSPEQFKALYADFGYNQAYAKDPASLSFVCEPLKGLVLLCIDTNKYEENKYIDKGDEKNYNQTSGRIRPATLTWMLAEADKARAKGKQVVLVQHHNVVQHYDAQGALQSDYIIKDYENVSKELIKHGVHMAFTGHTHLQDVAQYRIIADNAEPDSLIDVATGSVISYPNPWRTIKVNNDFTEWQFDTEYVKTIPSLSDVRTACQKRLNDNIKGGINWHIRDGWQKIDIFRNLLTVLGLPKNYIPEQPEELTDLLMQYLGTHTSKLYMIHNEGNEWKNPESAGLEEQLKSDLEKMLRDRAKAVGVDYKMVEGLTSSFNSIYTMQVEPGLKSMLTDINQYNASDKKLQSRTDDLSPVLHLGR
jgi:3',5'-cyclic AMP phosphodiesterase CpdA